MRNDCIPRKKLEEISSAIEAGLIKPPLDSQVARQLIEKTGLVDPEYYCLMNPDVRDAGCNPAEHFMEYGWREGRNPNIWFETNFYKDENPEIEPDLNPLLHYLYYGYKEGRRPNRNGLKTRKRLIAVLSPKPSQYKTVNAALKSLLAQTARPDKIIVYLGRETAQNTQMVFNFIELLDQGVEIHWCEDWGPYSGLASALQEYSEDILVACGSGHVYEPEFISTLYEAHRKNPAALQCVDAGKIIFGQNGTIFDLENTDPAKGALLLPYTELGMLVPPGYFSAEAYDEGIFMRHSPDFDSLWWSVLALSKKREINVLKSPSGLIRDHDRALDRHLEKIRKSFAEFEFQSLKLLFHYKGLLQAAFNMDPYTVLFRNKIEELYEKRLGQKIDFNSINDFNEKLNFLKLYDDVYLKEPLSDKYEVRKYVSAIVGEEYLVKLLGVWKTFDEIDFASLPQQFVLKMNNSSGGNLIVTNKATLDQADAREKFNKWIGNNYAFPTYEMNYFNISPLIIAEEYLGDNVYDYKFMCMNGKVKFIWVDIDRFSGHKRNVYSPDWRLQNWAIMYKKSEKEIPRPERLEEMIEIAEKLARPFIHARIDFFILKDALKIGEITFYSEAGLANFFPRSAALTLGREIQLPEEMLKKVGGVQKF